MKPASILLTLASLLLVTACAGGTTRSPRDARPRAPAPAAAGPAHAQAVAALVGVWHGRAVGTPFGDFAMAIAFDREPDGAVHGRLDNGPDMYLDFRFREDAGRWVLVEAGRLPDVGVQSTTLVPVAAAGAARWVDGADPTRLAVALAIEGDRLTMTTTLRGEPHAVFELRRATGPAADQIREAIARARPPAGGE